MLKYLSFAIILIGIVSGALIFFPELSDLWLSAPADNSAAPQIVFEEDQEEEEEVLNLSFEEFMNKGDSLFAGGFLTLASNNYAAALKLEPDNKNAYLKLINTYIVLRDFSTAEEVCQEALVKTKDDKDLLLTLGEIFIQSSRFNEAGQIFSKLPDTVPEKFFYLGALYAFNNQHEQAQANLDIAKNSKLKSESEVILGAYTEYSLFPKSSELHLRLLIAKAFNQLKLYEMAIQSTKSIIKENEKYRDAWLILGHSYLSLEKFDFAEKAFLNGLELDPTKPETSFFLGLTKAEMSDYESAVEYMNNALLNNYEPRIDVLRKLGDFYLQDENYSMAVRYYEEALHISDDSVDSFVRPVWILIDYIDNPEKAEEIARWALEKHPRSAMSYNLLGWAQIAKGEFGEAQSSLERALQIDSELSAAYLNLGNLYVEQDKIELALEQYRRAYELDPNSSVGASAANKFNELVKEYSE